jgi:molecular chaperone DnaK
MYKQAGPAAGAPGAGAGPQPGGETASSGSEQKKDEGVIDAEYVDVDEKK